MLMTLASTQIVFVVGVAGSIALLLPWQLQVLIGKVDIGPFISSPELLGTQGELIVYPSSWCPPVRPSTIFKDLLL